MRVETGKLMQQACAVGVRFAHAQNTATANCDPRAPDCGNGLQTLFVGPCADDVAIELRRGIQIVVVSGQSGVFKLLRLGIGQHS